MNNIIILAAGKGTRMRSKKAKVLQTLAGQPLLAHVINTAEMIDNHQLHVVIGHDAENIQQHFSSTDLNFVFQTEQLGTGHAVAQVLPHLADDGLTLVLYGDVPLVRLETLNALLAQVTADNMAVLTVRLDNPTGYGRIVRNNTNQVVAIVEEKDANAAEKLINECNSGIIAISNALLKQYLPKISNKNAQQEYYLTDLIALLANDKREVIGHIIDEAYQVQGVNDKKQLSDLERVYQQLQAEQLLYQGVSLYDAQRIDIRGQLQCGQEVEIDINCIFQGKVSLADGVKIGANCIIGSLNKHTVIGADTQILANSIIEEGVIGEHCTIGPFARIRPGTELANGVKIGNFVETKKVKIADGSKVNHLTYIGDAVIGKNVNIGAGTITCNYDGVNKFITEIHDDAFIGSNTSLVAPVIIGKTATIGAGSTITGNVADNELAVARGKQRNINNWQRPRKK